MLARIGIWQGTSDELERWVTRSREQVMPAVQQQSGIRGAYWLLDREARKALTITLWESEAALRASEQFRTQTQAGTAEASGAEVTTERYEVVASL
jgi:heme-degrading monooxygenase HmoA